MSVDLRNDILKQEVTKVSERLIHNAPGITSKAEDLESLHSHMNDYLSSHDVPENVIKQVAIDNLIENIYKAKLSAAARSKKTRQGDIFGAGLPQVILLKNTDTYIRFDMAREDELESWISQKRTNVRQAQEALYLDEDDYAAIRDAMKEGHGNNAGEAVAYIRGTAGEATG